LITAGSAGEVSAGGAHTTGRMTFLPARSRSFTTRYDRG
jgi:hypothetical protein